jgi:hypothetical protein
MILLKIFLGILILGFIGGAIQALSVLKLTDLEQMLDLKEDQRLSFLRRKQFKMISGSYVGNDYWFQGGFQKDELWFPHDNEKILEHIQFYGKKNLNTGKDIELLERFYLAYRVKSSYGDKFVKRATKKGYVEVVNPDFEKEGFDYLGIEEIELEGQMFYWGSRGRSYKLFKNQNYGLVQAIQNKPHFHFFTIYKL